MSPMFILHRVKDTYVIESIRKVTDGFYYVYQRDDGPKSVAKSKVFYRGDLATAQLLQIKAQTSLDKMMKMQAQLLREHEFDVHNLAKAQINRRTRS